MDDIFSLKGVFSEKKEGGSMKIKKLVFILIGIGVGISLVFAYVVLREGKTTVSLEVLNSDFEMGLDKPDSWSEDPRGGWSIDTENPYAGERCMQATESWGWLWQEVSVEPEEFGKLRFCQLEVYVKSDIEAEEDALLTLESLNEKGEVVEVEYGVISATSSWQLKKSLIFLPKDKDIRKIRIKLAKRQGEGSVWFDKVDLIRTSSFPLLNPSFETGLDRPDSWREDPKGGWSIETEDPYIGKRYMQATESWSYLWQEIPAEPEKFYKLRVSVKSDIKAGENALLTLECRKEDGTVIGSEYGVINATSSWQLQENSILAPKDTRKIRIKLAKRQGGGSVWFDGVELKKLPSYMRIKFLRAVAEDKPFFIFYFLIYVLLFFFLLKIVLKK